MSLLQDTVWLLFVVLLFVTPGIVAAILCAPFLVSHRIRRLFAALPPGESLLPTYVVGIVLASLPFVLGLGAIVLFVPFEGAAVSNSILTLVQYLAVGYVLVVPTALVYGLPRAGIAWDPQGPRGSSWAILALGGFWFTVTFAVPMSLLAIVLVLPGGY